jgi:hypothetical protein
MEQEWKSMAVNLIKARLEVRLNINEFCAEFANVLNMDSLGNWRKQQSEKKLLEKTPIFLLLP